MTHLRLLGVFLIGCSPAAVAPRVESFPPPVQEIRASIFAADWEEPPWPERDSPPQALGGPVSRSLRGSINHIRWSPRGRIIAVATSEKEVAIVDSETGVLRAYRRVMTRRDDEVEFVGFDPTGTRLVLLATDESRSALIVWDLHDDRLQTLTSRRDDLGEGFVVRGGVVLRLEEHNVLLGFDGSTRPFPDGTPLGWLDHGAGSLLERDGDIVRVSAVGEELGSHPGEWVAIHPAGAAFAILIGDTMHVLRSDGEEAGRVTVDGATEGGWTHEGLFVEVLGPPARIEYDDTLTEVARYMSSVNPVGDRIGMVGQSVLRTEVESGQIAVHPLRVPGSPEALPASHRLLEPFPNDEARYDDYTGQQIVAGGLELGPNGRFLVTRGRSLFVFDAQFELQATSDPPAGGESSIWGTEADAHGGFTWGRAGTEYWGPGGAIRFPCGEGRPLRVDGEAAWADNFQLCVDGRAPRPLSAPGEARNDQFVGVRGNQLVVATSRDNVAALAFWDPVRWAARRTVSLPDAMICEEGDCFRLYAAVGRGGIVLDEVRAYWDNGRASVARPIEDVLEPHRIESTRRGAILVTRLGFVFVDPRGRVALRRPEATQPQLSQGGTTVAYWRPTDRQLVVESVPSGTVRLNAPLEENPDAVLLGDELVAANHDSVWTVWHVPSQTQRMQLAQHDVLAFVGNDLAVCSRDVLTLRSGADGSVLRALGACPLLDDITLLQDGQVLALRSRTRVTLVRWRDGVRVEVGNVRGASAAAFAHQGDRAWLPGNAASALRWRGPGAIPTAPMEEDPTPHHDPELLRTLFAGP